MQIEWHFCPFIRASHYPGLKATELSLTEQEKVLGGTPRIFRPPSKLKDLAILCFYSMNENNNQPPILFFGVLSEKQQIKFHWPYDFFCSLSCLSTLDATVKWVVVNASCSKEIWFLWDILFTQWTATVDSNNGDPCTHKLKCLKFSSSLQHPPLFTVNLPCLCSWVWRKADK